MDQLQAPRPKHDIVRKGRTRLLLASLLFLTDVSAVATVTEVFVTGYVAPSPKYEYFNLDENMRLTRMGQYRRGSDCECTSGFQLTFSDEFQTAPDDVVELGLNNEVNYPMQNGGTNMPDRIDKVFICEDENVGGTIYKDRTESVWLNDGAAKTNGNNVCDWGRSKTIDLTGLGRLRGISFGVYECGMEKSLWGNFQRCIEPNSWSLFIDDDPCSQERAQLIPTPSSMTLYVNEPPVDVSWEIKTKYGNTACCPSFKTDFHSDTPKPSFLSLDPLIVTTTPGILTGHSTDYADAHQTHSFKFQVDCEPYDREILWFDVEIKCTIEAPFLEVPDAQTIKLAVDPLPFDIPFKQTAATIGCGKVTTAVYSPNNPIFFLTNEVDQSGGNIQVNPTIIDVGIYTITLINTALDSSYTKEKVITLEILHPCSITQMTGADIADITDGLIASPSSYDIFFDDEMSSGPTNVFNAPESCGPLVFDFSPTYPWLLVKPNTPGSRKLEVDTFNPADAGTYNLSLDVWLQDWSATVPPITKTFKVTITCEIFSITITESPPAYNYYEMELDDELVLSFGFQEYPLCGLVYELAPEKPFATYDETGDGKIHIDTMDKNDEGLHTFEIIATPENGIGVTSQVTFDVFVNDLCLDAVFYPQTLYNLAAFNQDPNFTSPGIIKFTDFQYEPQNQWFRDCGPIKYQVVSANNPNDIPDFISVQGSDIKVDFLSMPPGTFNGFLVTSLENYPDKEIRTPFTVSLKSVLIKCLSGTTKEYNMGDPPLEFSIGYVNITEGGGTSLTRTLEPVAVVGNSPVDLPGFVKYNPGTKMFTVADIIPPRDFGEKQIGLKIGFQEYPSFKKVCTTKINNWYTQSFKSVGDPAGSYYQIPCGQPWQMHIPIYLDAFGKKARLEVDLGNTQDFLEWDPDVRNITMIEFDREKLSAGTYTIKFILSDQFQYIEEQDIRLELQCYSFLDKIMNGDDPLKEWVLPTDVQDDPPVPYIQVIDQFGRVRVAFDRIMWLPTFAEYPEFQDHRLMRQNCTNTTYANPDNCMEQRLLQKEVQSKKDTLATNDTISTQNTKTKEAIEIVNRALVFQNSTFYPVVQLEMYPGEDSNWDDLEFRWKCVDFKETYFEIEVNFTKYMNVSIHDFSDDLKVKFNGHWYFKAKKNSQFVQKEVSLISKRVPLQMDPQSRFGEIAGFGENSAKTIIVLNFLLNVLLGGAIQQLFNAIRKLSIMLHLLIMKVKIPANAMVFFSAMFGFISFDIIETEPYVRPLLNLYNDEVINDNFYDLGYPSNYFVINIGSLTIGVVYFFVLYLFYLITMRCTNPKFMGYRNKIVHGLFWNALLSFLTEVYIIFSISTIANFLSFDFNSFGTALSANFTLIASVILFGFPIAMLWYMMTKPHKLHQPKVKNKCGAIYEGLNYKRVGKVALLEPFFFYLRVQLLVFALLMLQHLVVFQIIIALALMTFMLIYTGLASPYITKSKTFFEQFNEFFIAITIYHLMAFADVVQDQHTRNVFGWSMICCISFCLIVNLGYIMTGVLRDTYKKLRTKYYKNKLAKLKAKQKLKPRINKPNIPNEEMKDSIAVKSSKTPSTVIFAHGGIEEAHAPAPVRRSSRRRQGNSPRRLLDSEQSSQMHSEFGYPGYGPASVISQPVEGKVKSKVPSYMKPKPKSVQTQFVVKTFPNFQPGAIQLLEMPPLPDQQERPIERESQNYHFEPPPTNSPFVLSDKDFYSPRKQETIVPRLPIDVEAPDKMGEIQLTDDARHQRDPFESMSRNRPLMPTNLTKDTFDGPVLNRAESMGPERPAMFVDDQPKRTNTQHNVNLNMSMSKYLQQRLDTLDNDSQRKRVSERKAAINDQIRDLNSAKQMFESLWTQE